MLEVYTDTFTHIVIKTSDGNGKLPRRLSTPAIPPPTEGAEEPTRAKHRSHQSSSLTVP